MYEAKCPKCEGTMAEHECALKLSPIGAPKRSKGLFGKVTLEKRTKAFVCESCKYVEFYTE